MEDKTENERRVSIERNLQLVAYQVTVDRTVSLLDALGVLRRKVLGAKYFDRIPLATGDEVVAFSLYPICQVIPSKKLDEVLARDGFELLIDPLAVVALYAAEPALTTTHSITLLRDLTPETSWCLGFSRLGSTGVWPRGNINLYPGWWVPVVPLRKSPASTALTP